MADIYGTHFELGGESSRQYGLIIASMESQRNMYLYGSVSGVFSFNKAQQTRSVIGNNYTSSHFSFEVEIMNEDGLAIEIGQKRSIEKWLFGNLGFRKMYFDQDDDCLNETYEYVNGSIKRLYMNCRFVNPQKIESDSGVVGYRATLEADSDMLWQDTVSFTFSSEDISASNSVITVNVDTDAHEYTYPKVSVKIGNTGGDISIVNNTDSSSRITKFYGLTPLLSFYFTGGINYVSEGNYERFSGRNFIRLLPGENKLYITGDISEITFEWNNKRYM